MSEQLLGLSFWQYKNLRNQIRNFQYQNHNKIKKISALCPFTGFLKYVDTSYFILIHHVIVFQVYIEDSIKASIGLAVVSSYSIITHFKSLWRIWHLFVGLNETFAGIIYLPPA